MNSDYQTGRLVEISPFGTGFVEDEKGTRYGFHYSMIKNVKLPDGYDWPKLLTDLKIEFRLVGDVVRDIKSLNQDIWFVSDFYRS